ncbi:MAG: PqqD family protein [Thermoanaerobaculia bacterium]
MTSGYRPAVDVVCRRIGDESILVPVRHNVGNLDSVFTLSPIAVRIWEMLDGTKTAAEIAEALTGEYDVDRGTALADVNELLGSLLAAELIVESK